ncbi:MAG: hypothetical protein IH957_03240 [Chloroflexi bacterium]|nr:hypothetical protein [Chloroflexota bacterium]
MAAVVAAIAIAFDFTGESALGADVDAIRAIAFVALGAFVALTVVREGQIFLDPRPRVEYSGLSPATNPVTIRYQHANGNWKTETKRGSFHRIRVQNRAHDPSGDESVAKDLSARIELRDSGGLVESWMGRWSDQKEAEDLGEKWELDRIDLPPNGQEATLDIGVNYVGEPGFFRWDNSRFVGDYNAERRMGSRYEVWVLLKASNMSEREFRFSLESEPDSEMRLLPMIRRWRSWSVHAPET